MSIFDSFLAIKKARGDATAQAQELRQKADGLRARSAAIQAAGPAKADVRAAADKWVDDMAARFTAAMQSRISALVQHPASSMNQTQVNHVMSLVGEALSREESPSLRLDQTLCGLFGPQVKSALAEAIDGMAWAEGLPLADRPAALGGLREELRVVMKEEAELLAAAKEAGIALGNQPPLYIR
jgi:hypothetical protein